MKNILYIFLALLTSFFISCDPLEPKPEGNSRLTIKNITFHELSAAEKLTGKVITKTYVATDTSSSLIINTSTNTFDIKAPVNFNQFYDYNLPAGIKKITFDISFNITGTIAERLTLEDVNFTHNGNSMYSRTNIEFVDAGANFVLPTIEVNF